MKRRRFLKLLAAIPLALGLRLSVAERESEPVWGRTDDGGKTWQQVDNKGRIIYISDHGDDLNDGLSPNTAKQTIAAAVNCAIDSYNQARNDEVWWACNPESMLIWTIGESRYANNLEAIG